MIPVAGRPIIGHTVDALGRSASSASWWPPVTSRSGSPTLEANEHWSSVTCGALSANVLEEGASIDPTARLRGPVRLERGSRVGAHVVAEGGVWVGDGVTIDNGAILQGANVIGDRSRVANGCLLSRGATVGSDCVIDHCAELSGVIMDGVRLYHYMEVCGVVGTRADLGAATVCGTLRFDDGDTTHVVRGRPERPSRFSNCAYLGDYCRTGVNAILMPGCRVGVYSVVGAGVVLNEDVPDRTLVYAEQKLVRRPWGPERYGW